MKKIVNENGFTLVELLAVIVVLAIVMLIGVQAVLPQIEKARRQTIALEAQSAIEAAQTYFMSNTVTGAGAGKELPAKTGDVSCVTIGDLINAGQFSVKNGTYSGRVKVKKINDNIYLYKIWLNKDSKWVITGKGADLTSGSEKNKKITENDVDDYTSSWNYTTCDTTSF